MATSLISVNVSGFDTQNPGDPVASVALDGMSFQAGDTALWGFVSAVASLVAGAQNVDTVVTTKYESVSTIV